MYKRFIPAARFSWFTSFFDVLCALFGFGKSYRNFVMHTLKLNSYPCRVLDVGCGTGTLLIELKRKYQSIQFYGVDPDAAILRIATRKAEKANVQINLKQAFAQKLPFASRSFDVVYSSLVFHHLPTDVKKKVLEEIHRVLKNKGRFVLSDFGKPRHHFLLFPWFACKFEEGYDNYRGRVPTMIKSAGFRIVQKIGEYRHGIVVWKGNK